MKLRNISGCISFTIYLILSILVLPADSAAGAPWKQVQSESNDPHALKILFIGHSIFYWHDVPKMFCDMVKDKNPNQPLKVQSVVGDAYSLQNHLNDGLAMRTIKSSGPWDYVVLFEQTSLAESKPDEYEKSLETFEKEIRAINAKTVLVENYNDSPDGDAETRETYSKFGNKYQASVIPVGSAWSYARQQYPQINLYDSDGHHPSAKGTFLISSLLYSFFAGKTSLNQQTSVHSSTACTPAESEQLESVASSAVGNKSPKATAPSVVQQQQHTQLKPTTVPPYAQSGIRNY